MKKSFRQILLLLVVLLLLLSFTGCAGLDQMRQQQAFICEDGSILWNGCTYMPLPESAYFMPTTSYASTIYTTEPDVPVLLSGILFKETLYASTDGRFLINVKVSNITHYCREDLYEEITARILAPFTPEIVCYSYNTYNTKRYYILTEEQTTAITQVVETTEPLPSIEGWYLDYDMVFRLYESSRDMLFQRAYLDIGAIGNSYYLTLYTYEEALNNAVPQGCYAVPEDFNPIFDEIISSIRNA